MIVASARIDESGSVSFLRSTGASVRIQRHRRCDRRSSMMARESTEAARFGACRRISNFRILREFSPCRSTVAVAERFRSGAVSRAYIALTGEDA